MNASVTVRAQFAALLALSEEAVIGLDPDGTIALWSPAAETLYGYAAPEAVGQPLALVFAPERRKDAAEIAGRALRGEPVGPRETVGRGSDGQERDVLVRAAPVAAEDGRSAGALLLARDIAPKRQADRALRRIQERANRRAVVLETADRVALDILAQRTGQEALRHIAEAARRLTGARGAYLGIARPDGSGLEDILAAGAGDAGDAAADLLREALSRREPLRVPGLLCLAIRRENEALGGLCLVGRERGGSFTDEDETSLQALAAHAAVAIHHLRLLHRQRWLVRGLVGAHEEERRTIAYELHDGLTQHVMAAHLHLELCWEAREAGDEDRVAREMDRSLDFLREAAVESRRLVNGLRALVLDDLGLAGALEQLLSEEKERAGWGEADFAHNVAGRRFDAVLETTAYRVAQEALTNARKHARAGRVRLLLLRGADPDAGAPTLTLEVRDWGAGFLPAEKTGDWGHLGLHGMAERVRLLGGTYELRSAPGEGTTVRAVLPALPPPPPESGANA